MAKHNVVHVPQGFRCTDCGELWEVEEACPGAQPLKLIWKIREDGRWVTFCACGAMLAGMNGIARLEAEEWHFAAAEELRASMRGTKNEIPSCGPLP